MPSKPEERLDRRDFMIASIATVGAPAALAANAGSANAQASATSSVIPALSRPSATVYTGDTIQGKKVVSALDVNDLERGKKHFLYFSGRSDAHRTVLVRVRDGRQGQNRDRIVVTRIAVKDNLFHDGPSSLVVTIGSIHKEIDALLRGRSERDRLGPRTMSGSHTGRSFAPASIQGDRRTGGKPSLYLGLLALLHFPSLHGPDAIPGA
jgi:hypothetical protein